MHRFKRLGPINGYVIIPILVIYFLLVVLLPANKTAMQSYHLSSSAYHILLFVVELPLAATWLAAFYGFFKLRQYTTSIAKSPEENGFNQLTTGFQWLAWSLVLPTFLSLITGSIASRHPHFHPTAVILSNYLSLIFPLIAYVWIANGSEQLLTLGRKNQKAIHNLKAMLALFAILGGFYGYLTLRQLNLSNLGASNNPYYLPSWLLVTTIIIPYLFAWFVGLMGAYEINTLARHAKGLLYRQGLNLIAGGVTLVIGSSIGAQCIRSIVPRTGHLALNVVLVVVYVFYLIIILGFALIGLGANRLKKIEDI